MSTFEKNQRREGKKQKRTKHVGPTILGKYFDIHTIYLILRRAHWDSNEKKFIPEKQILFCSNPLKPCKLQFITEPKTFFLI